MPLERARIEYERTGQNTSECLSDLPFVKPSQFVLNLGINNLATSPNLRESVHG